jgi:hypothetical protein
MVRRFAAVVVQDDRFAEQLCDGDGREGRQEEGCVRRREGMNDIRAAKFANQQRPVPELGDERPQVLDVEQPIERPAGHGIDRDDPRVDRAVGPPYIQQSPRQHRMPANNPSRRNDDGDPERMWQGILHTAEVSGAKWVQATRRRNAKYARISEPQLTIGGHVAVEGSRERLSVCAYRIEITPPKH